MVGVGWKFKGPRFDLHRSALRYPADRFAYVGVNDPPRLTENLPFEARRREGFVTDPYGAAPEPKAKREARNVFHRRHGYGASCPELAGLLAHTGHYPGAYRISPKLSRRFRVYTLVSSDRMLRQTEQLLKEVILASRMTQKKSRSCSCALSSSLWVLCMLLLSFSRVLLECAHE